jgi:acetoacetyl-CoA synthetase
MRRSGSAQNAAPRQLPARVLQVADTPRSKSGKIGELARCYVVHGRAVKKAEALANPAALESFRNRHELRNWARQPRPLLGARDG